MSTINPTTIQDVSQDPGTHPIGILDQNINLLFKNTAVTWV